MKKEEPAAPRLAAPEVAPSSVHGTSSRCAKRHFLTVDEDLTGLDDDLEAEISRPEKRCKPGHEQDREGRGEKSSTEKKPSAARPQTLSESFEVARPGGRWSTKSNSTLIDTFSLTQDGVVSSTPKPESAAKKSDTSISPVSIKTLSKLRAFAAPPRTDLDKASKTDEGYGASIVDNVSAVSKAAVDVSSVEPGQGSSLQNSISAEINFSDNIYITVKDKTLQ
jgi:hypothetical protein